MTEDTTSRNALLGERGPERCGKRLERRRTGGERARDRVRRQVGEQKKIWLPRQKATAGRDLLGDEPQEWGVSDWNALGGSHKSAFVPESSTCDCGRGVICCEISRRQCTCSPEPPFQTPDRSCTLSPSSTISSTVS